MHEGVLLACGEYLTTWLSHASFPAFVLKDSMFRFIIYTHAHCSLLKCLYVPVSAHQCRQRDARRRVFRSSLGEGKG